MLKIKCLKGELIKANNQINWSWLLLAYVSLFIMGYFDNSRGAAYPYILKELKLTPSLGSWFFSLASLSGLFVFLSAKKWIPIIGIVGGSKASLVIMGLSSFCMGFLPELPFQYFFLLLFSMLFGVGQGLSSYCMNLLVAEGSTIQTRSRAFSALHSCYGVASFIAPLLFGQFLEWSGYWSSFYMYMGVLPFIVFIFIFKIGRGVPVNHYGKELSGLKFSKRFRYGAVFSFYVASEIIISSRLVYYLMEAKAYSSEAAREGLSLFFLSLMLGRLTFAFLPIRGKSYQAMVASLLLSLSLFIYGYLYNPLVLGLLGGTMSFYFPMGMDWLTSKFEKSREEMIASVMTQIGVMLIVMHVFFGFIASKIGVEKALLLTPALLITSLIFLLILRNDNSNDVRPLRPL